MRTTHCSLDIADILNKGAFTGSKQKSSQLQQLQTVGTSPEPVTQHAAASSDPTAAVQPNSTQQPVPASSNGFRADMHMGSGQDDDSTQQSGQHAQSTDVQSQQQQAQEASHHQHSSHVRHDHAGHDHLHNTSGHLKAVRSLSLVHQGEVDLSRYVSCAQCRRSAVCWVGVFDDDFQSCSEKSAALPGSLQQTYHLPLLQAYRPSLLRVPKVMCISVMQLAAALDWPCSCIGLAYMKSSSMHCAAVTVLALRREAWPLLGFHPPPAQIWHLWSVKCVTAQGISGCTPCLMSF